MSYLRSLEGRPIAYLVEETQKKVDTGKGQEFLGSSLASQLPLIEVPAQPAPDSTPCGNLAFPKASTAPGILEDLKSHWQDLQITVEEAQQLERDTQGQCSSKAWHKHRANRITASTFGHFMKRKQPVNDKFLKNTLNRRPFTSEATAYGTKHEKVARLMYAKKQSVHVHGCGLVISIDYPFLAGSPDGKVCDNGVTGIIEIKCPSSVKDLTIEQAVSSEKAQSFFLEKVGASEYRLKRDHIHWFQVQGQLLVSGAPFCDFITFTQQDLHVERILPDIVTMNSILKMLAEMYINHVKTYLTVNAS